ncbi:MAG: DUF2666 family protein [Candidatus ainarchaeum sp.]|nr:DUF2666 family protein [Candidatus ainarchaeum sp.]
MEEEIILTGKYKEFECDEHYLLKGASEEEVSFILSNLSKKIEHFSYEYSGIEISKIEKYVIGLIGNTNGISTVINILSKIKPGELKDNLLLGCKGNKELIPVAESYFIHLLLTKCKVDFKISGTCKTKPIKEKQDGRIAFVGNYKGWMSIKKLKIENTTKEYEVSGIISSINHTIVNKMFEFAGVEDEPSVEKIIKGKRKGLVALAEALKEINEKDAKKQAYLVCKVCEKLGYTPYSTPHMLVKAHPDIKPPKPKGRMKK